MALKVGDWVNKPVWGPQFHKVVFVSAKQIQIETKYGPASYLPSAAKDWTVRSTEPHKFQAGDKVRLIYKPNKDVVTLIRRMPGTNNGWVWKENGRFPEWDQEQSFELVEAANSGPTIDWSKPVRHIGLGEEVRVLTVGGIGTSPTHPVIIAWKDGSIERITSDGRLFAGCDVRYENVPPPKAVITYDVVMQRRADGKVRTRTTQLQSVHDTATWKTIARKQFTITEGEGL